MVAHLNIAATETAPTIAVAILYEDWGTGLRAKRTCDLLEQQLMPKVSFSFGLWRFDLLEEHALREQAASAAGNSDIVFISAHGRGALPETVESWLQQWLLQKPAAPTALVLSLDANTKGTAKADEILASLAHLAPVAEVDLFSHFGRAHHLQSEPTSKAALLSHPAAPPSTVPRSQHN